MKAITVKQPWASLIVHGIKDVENRTWRTNYRGRVLIHAAGSHGRKFNVNLTDAQTTAAFATIAKETMFENMPFGSVIGSVEIVDCVQNHPSIWAEKGVYNWVLANPVCYSIPAPAKGKLSFWNFEGVKEVKIKCPECGSIELAAENYTTVPFPVFLHECQKCGFVIMESDWDRIKE